MILNQKVKSHTQPKSRTKSLPIFMSVLAIHIGSYYPL